jgi:hypothetical protein
MAWFKKKPDPISDRARTLNSEIAALEEKIKRLDSQLQRDPTQPRLRSTARPHGEGGNRADVQAPPPAVPREPIFEPVDRNRLNGVEAAGTPAHYNELGVRKYDLPALWRRIQNHFAGPSTTNPKLINYLAAGGIQGLRPLRYEKRVARNRLLLLVAFIFVILFGIYWVVFIARSK